jgi:hypothetical protein
MTNQKGGGRSPKRCAATSNLRVLRLRGDSLTNAAARALANMLRVNHTLQHARSRGQQDRQRRHRGDFASALADNQAASWS